ncbi:hypothetical protein GGS23DRAFT_327871 [Durotheca rogersii]|uniref:uncharacterized protein n=1 Tax=Durotheca rogersii TaxID=419775 RepID=UPI00221F3633|nr:uncharacterized protein GGS23DRAFT_327871 [Durotheca rogersii]KAI5859285.1 hypothetical protein GGS23DRAFT_327871 [Durotheca rogersii]
MTQVKRGTTTPLAKIEQPERDGRHHHSALVVSVHSQSVNAFLDIPPWKVSVLSLPIFICSIIWVTLLVIFILYASHMRSFVKAMADRMNPQTPPRKLFKPSSKTKTPTSGKKQGPTTPTTSHHQSETTGFTPGESAKQTGATSPSTRPATRPTADDISKSAILAPLTSTNIPSDRVDDYTSSAAAGNPPVGSIDNDVLTPTDTISQSTHVPSILSRGASEATVGARPGSYDGIPSSPERDASYMATGSGREHSPLREKMPDQRRNTAASIDGKLQEVSHTANINPARPLNPADNASSSHNIAEYFGEQGNPEMSTSASVVAGTASRNTTDASGGATNSKKDPLGTEGDKRPSSPEPVGPRKAGRVAGDSGDRNLGLAPASVITRPDTASIPDEAKVSGLDRNREAHRSARGLPSGIQQTAANTRSGAQADGSRTLNNLGNPTHIERRIEFPLPRPEKIVDSPPDPIKPDTSNITASLGGANDLPGTEDLPSTEDLANLPGDVSQDPPEEILDPSVHSASTNVSPIPKVPIITPLAMDVPHNLSHLARGLGGNTVDDVGNIIDASGNVLGHASGDLPTMVGKKIAEDGKVYGDGGELIGYVSENFTAQSHSPNGTESVLGGLAVDHHGNILDASGNIIGHFNDKSKGSSYLPPFEGQSKTNQTQAEDISRTKPALNVNAHSGGSPSDIFLDVKSTTDGIQLIIRIPTTFGRQQSEQ